MTKFKTGDRVRVVKYGHLIWSNTEITDSQPGIRFYSVETYDTRKNYLYDIAPDVVGQEGVIVKATQTQGIDQYSIDGIKGKSSWYNNDQLEKL
jgi:hypothetical protein